MQRWLAAFADHVVPSGWIFLLAALVALLVALATVGYEAMKAALADPVQRLRYE